MPCSAYWQRLVENGVLNKYPGVFVVQARAYCQPHTVRAGDREVVLPGILPDPGDPLHQMRRFLRSNYDPDAAPYTQVLLFHPRGGLSFVRVTPSDTLPRQA